MEDVGERPNSKLSIDRIDNQGHYSCGKCEQCRSEGWPANVRWATKKVQGNNRRDNHLVTWNGKTQSIAAWADEVGLPQGVLRHRLTSYGWEVEEAMTTPVGNQGPRKYKKTG